LKCICDKDGNYNYDDDCNDRISQLVLEEVHPEIYQNTGLSGLEYRFLDPLNDILKNFEKNVEIILVKSGVGGHISTEDSVLQVLSLIKNMKTMINDFSDGKLDYNK